MLYRACGDEEWLQRARCFGLMILDKNIRAAQRTPDSPFSDQRAEVISMALNEEQRCENALAVRENQVNSTSILSEKVEQEKLELARNLRVRREMLMSKKDALQSILAERKMSVEELIERRNRMKPLESKRCRVQELSESCEVTQQNIAFYSVNF
ncbi:unnamed protein product [Nippostrongylus brasiliensis]|uniref:Uncharacterized protein n=1 Tax=Nippostrongylus brasiliensis TaxID=27835 RepID=A0A0N4YKF0_NIPBR|nr:unnamed protein product [Nippostrongylus brasiliensis]